ncbi:MAG TPA: glycosyltransferase [Myxococcota bacterium]|nr:glycosyltransferase [Myxococcota bacterium]
MKLLVVCARPPWPPTMADAMTVERMLRFLSARGHAVDLLCFTEHEAATRALRAGLAGACREIESVELPRWRSYASTALTLPLALPMQVQYYRSREMRRAVERRVARGGYDAVYTHLIRMAEYTRRLPVAKLLGVQISQALNLGRMHAHSASPLRRLFYRIEAAKVRPYEAAVCADYERVLLCGAADIRAIERSAPIPNARICPHGQDIPPLERVRAAQRVPGSIVLSGVMSTYTNVDAACWFAREVFPLVERRVPEAKFWIVGRNPQRAVRALQRESKVTVTGEVPDVHEWLCRAQVAVAPLRIGAGMQNKIVQAMACELPVVATSVANEGIGAKPPAQILLCDDPRAMADAVVGLLRDAQARRAIGAAARELVEAHWSWDANFERLEGWLEEAVAMRGARQSASAPAVPATR